MFVCTGNQFRSPLAAAVFERETAGQPVRVSSVGTHALRGAPALAELAKLGPAHGVDVSEHRSSRLVRGQLADADLVVGFERLHVEQAVIEGGAPRERAFTLPELLGLLENGELPTGAAAALAAADAERSGARLHLPEIADPLGEPRGFQERVADEVEDLTRRLARVLFPR